MAGTWSRNKRTHKQKDERYSKSIVKFEIGPYVWCPGFTITLIETIVFAAAQFALNDKGDTETTSMEIGMIVNISLVILQTLAGAFPKITSQENMKT